MASQAAKGKILQEITSVKMYEYIANRVTVK